MPLQCARYEVRPWAEPARKPGNMARAVVVGEPGAVSRWRMPCSAQMRSKRTSPFPGPKRPVKTLPLSDKIASGWPWCSIASMSASHTGAAVARATTLAHTQNREWSSMPVTIDGLDPSASGTPKVTSICHSSMGRERSQRL